MEITPQVLILVGIVCVVLGFIANLLLNTLHEDAGNPASEPGDPDAAPPGGKKGRYDRISQLWRERGTGRLIVEIEGKSYVNPNPLTEMQRGQLETTARDLHTWLGGAAEYHGGAPVPVLEESIPPAAKPAPPAIVPPTAAAQAPKRETAAPPASQAPASPLVPPAQQKPPSSSGPAKPPVSSTTSMPAVEIPNVPPARSTSGKKTSQSAAEEKAAAVSNLSIVAQIEEIFQDMIAGTPLAARDIHLQEDPQRGVIVRVGNDEFEGIDSVTDPEVKAAIREAVVAWENGAWRFKKKK
jgi:hypothetical protein